MSPQGHSPNASPAEQGMKITEANPQENGNMIKRHILIKRGSESLITDMDDGVYGWRLYAGG